MTSNGRVEIELPTEISCKATTFTTCTVAGSNVGLTPVCVCNAALKLITVTNVFALSGSGNPVVSSLRIGPLRNPSSTAPTNPI